MILEAVKRSAEEHIRAWAGKKGLEPPAHVAFTVPPPHVAADLCIPFPLSAAKQLKRKPLEIANELASALSSLGGPLGDTDPPSASPPGFVNLKLTGAAIARNLETILRSPQTYGHQDRPDPRPVLVEFVSANPTGPLHLASGRAATLGDSLGRILKRIGRKTASEYYVNDAGNQAALMGLSVKARYEELHGRPAAMPEKGYQGEYIKTIAAAAPPEAKDWDAATFGRFGIDRMLVLHKQDMAKFGVSFDRWYLESGLHASGAVEKTLAWLKEHGVAYEKEGATWLGTKAIEAAEDDKDRVLVRADGRPTYFLADIAYHKDKFDRGHEELIDILGADHHGYVQRMKAAVAALGKPPEAFHAIIHQLVHLYQGKELVKMSKRSGEFVTLDELMADVGVDACRFFFARHTPNAHMNFDLELAKKQSQENPVFYVQYVHARICSIFREATKSLPDATPAAKADLLRAPEERALLVKLAWFPDVLRVCEGELSPHPLTSYLMELAGLYHPFYEKCRVVDPANPDLSRARLAVCGGVRAVIAEGLGLLGVSAPESM